MKVRDIITGYPEFLSDYQVITSNLHISKFGDSYLILGVLSQYGNYSDLICSIGNNYLSLGGGKEEYHKTVEVTERLSLLLECDRTLRTTSAYLIA